MVQILMATYNGEKFISKQISSLLNQTYTDIQVLIRDDDSKDGTVRIIEKYVESYPNKVVLIRDEVKCGSATSNFMQLTKYATSDYVMYCDQDDFWLPNKVEITLKAMEKAEKENGSDIPIMVFAKYKAVDGELNDLHRSEKGSQVEKKRTALNQLIVQNCVTGCLTMVNKTLYCLMGEYEKNILMHDWWAALIAGSMGRIVYIPEIVMLYRQHGNNVVGAVDVKSFQYRWHKLTDKKTKKMHFRYRDQMAIFFDRYENIMPNKSRICIKDFLDIYNTRFKLLRIYRVLKGGYTKSDIVRTLGLLLYI